MSDFIIITYYNCYNNIHMDNKNDKNIFHLSEPPFEITVNYSENDDLLFIEMVHCKDYFAWSIHISNSDELHSSQVLGIPLKPSYFYKLLFQHREKSLNELYKFTFPTTYKS